MASTRKKKTKPRKPKRKVGPQRTPKALPAARTKPPAARRPDRLAAERARLARNKRLVTTFYNLLFGAGDFDAARPYMSDTYRQHNPTATDGPDGLRQWIAEFKQAFPQHRFVIKHVLAEGDFVMLHLHGMNGPNPQGEAVIDLFRVERGRVAEHWDVIQPIPGDASNANSMF